MKPRVIHFDQQRAHDAYMAHIALLMAERADPMLKKNPVWTMLRQDAFELFVNAYEAV